MRATFYLSLFIYILFPRDDGIRLVGLGPEGSRILLFDFVVVLLLVGSLTVYGRSVKSVEKIVGTFPILLFWGATFYSLARGIPLFGGYAIGEARWYLSLVLLPVAYALYDTNTIKTIRRLFYVSAVWHSVIILLNLVSDSPWDTKGDVLRFAGGRESLIIGIGCIFLTDQISRMHRDGKRVGLRWTALSIFAGVLLIGQTRSLFILLPIVLTVYLFLRYRLSITTLAKSVLLVASIGVLIWSSVVFVLPRDVNRSVVASMEVVAEGFSADTREAILNPGQFNRTFDSDFSRSGNIVFRLLAWSQVLVSIDETPGGWFFGMPMGAGFEFYDPSGFLNVNLDPHNDYISILSKVGLVGLLGYLLVMWSFARHVWIARKSFGQCYQTSDIPVLFSIVLILALFAALNAEIRTYGTDFWIWSFLGFGFRAMAETKIAAHEIPENVDHQLAPGKTAG